MTGYAHGYAHEPSPSPAYSMNQQHPSQPAAYGTTYPQAPVNQSYYASSTNPPNYIAQPGSG